MSATIGNGLDALRDGIVSAMNAGRVERDVPAITNARHTGLVAEARRAIARAADAAGSGVPEEFVLADVHAARAQLENVTGRRAADAIVHAIFAKFCIGK